jgi:CBS domain-containing protein
MKVAEVMKRGVHEVGPDTSLCEVLQLLLRYHLNDVVVVRNGNELAGIVTYSDLFRKLLPTQQEFMENESFFTDPESMEDRLKDILNLPVKEIMTKRVYTVTPDTYAIKAGAMMNAHHVKQLPVVENHEVAGIISYTDIAWGLMMKYCEHIR